MTINEYITATGKGIVIGVAIIALPLIIVFGLIVVPILLSFLSGIFLIQGIIYIIRYIVLNRPNPEDDIAPSQISSGEIIAMTIGSAAFLALNIWLTSFIFKESDIHLNFSWPEIDSFWGFILYVGVFPSILGTIAHIIYELCKKKNGKDSDDLIKE